MIPCPWDAKVYELMIRANYLTSYKCATRRTSTSVCLSFKKKKKINCYFFLCCSTSKGPAKT